MVKKAETATATAMADPAGALAEVQRLADRELELGKLYREKAAELAGIRAQRGRQVLDASDPSVVVGEIGKRVREVEDELEAIGEAAAVSRQARLAAIPAVFRAEADDAERRAAELDGVAAQNEAKVREALEVVQRLADWPFVAALPQQSDRPYGGSIEGGSVVVVDARGPRYERLRRDATALRERAGQLRYQQPETAGTIVAQDLEQLIAEACSDVMRLAPPLADLYAWAETAPRRTRIPEKERRHTPADAFVAIDEVQRELWTLVWSGGRIDAAASMITTPAVGSVTTDEFERATEEAMA